MKDFPFVKREQANEGKKLELIDGNGKPTGYWLMVASSYSDTYKVRKGRVMRELAESVIENRHDDENQIKLTAKMVAAAITGWNVPEEFGEFNAENAEKMMLDYPQICDAVDKFSARDENYLAKK